MEEDFVSMHREILELAMQREKLCDQMFQRVMRELDSGIITYDEAMERVKVIDEEKAKTQHILDLQQDLLDRTKIKGKD